MMGTIQRHFASLIHVSLEELVPLFAEHWGVFDQMGMLAQLGAFPGGR